jgi:hypothetical protein
MQTHTASSYPFCAGAFAAVLALVWFDSTLTAQTDQTRRLADAPRSIRFAAPASRVHLQRVDFVLDAAPPAKSDETPKKRKTEQHRAPAAKPRPAARTASESVASSAAGNALPAAVAPAGQAVNPASAGSATAATAQPTGQASRPAVAAPAPASSADVAAGSSAAHTSVTSASSSPAGVAGRPRLSREQLVALLPGSTMSRTNLAGALREWVNKPDGTLTVYWGGASLRNKAHSASGHWSVTLEGRFCLQIDWDDRPENWCRFLEPTADGTYQPLDDIADANWTPPADRGSWRPLTIRH